MTTSLTAHRAHAIVQPGGPLTVAGLPLQPGQDAEVIALAQPASNRPSMQEVRHRLRGSVVKYKQPFEPAIHASPEIRTLS